MCTYPHLLPYLICSCMASKGKCRVEAPDNLQAWVLDLPNIRRYLAMRDRRERYLVGRAYMAAGGSLTAAARHAGAPASWLFEMSAKVAKEGDAAFWTKPIGPRPRPRVSAKAPPLRIVLELK